MDGSVKLSVQNFDLGELSKSPKCDILADRMSTVPAPQQPSQSLEYDYPEVLSNVAAVSALKKLVARLQREQSKTQDLLGSLSFSLRSFNNLNQFLALIPLIVSRVTDADAAALLLFRPNGQVSLEQLYCHEGHQCRNIRFALETATQYLTTNASTATNTSDELEQQFSHLLAPEYHWYSNAILVRNFEPHERGRLYLFSSEPNYEWTETRQKLAQLVADQTAVAIENDELTVQLRKQERLARELEIGAEIQARLLPNHCPSIQGIELAATCKTASQVGGDYYDFIPVETKSTGQSQTSAVQSQRWSLVIGDVMGKGVPAGLIMTMTRGILRTNILSRHSPAQILQNLNRVMYTDLENSNRFVTLFYSEYDPPSRMLRFGNAAHHPPLLWRAQTNTIERLDTNGMLIGLAANSRFYEGQTQLHPGDTIIYYTDGFTDAANPNGERFDEANLIKTFLTACHNCPGPQAILDYLYSQVEAFIGDQNRNGDDMTLIVLQVTANLGRNLVTNGVEDDATRPLPV